MKRIILFLICVLIILSGFITLPMLIEEVTKTSWVNGSSNVENIFESEQLVYSSTALNFYEDLYSSNYYYQIELIPVTNFNGLEKEYTVELNGYTILNAEINAGSVQFTFYVDFYDTNANLLDSAVLTVRAEFYADRTELIFETDNSQSSQYLEGYFENNGVRLVIQEKE